MPATLPAILAAARVQRDAGAWDAALRLYQAAAIVDGSAEIRHNLALCHFGLGALDAAIRHSTEALSLKPDLWQSRLIQAKILRARGQIELTHQALTAVLRHAPANGPALLALADIEMNEFGDPLAAAARVAPLHRTSEHRADAELTLLMAKLYDRDESDEQLSAALRDFAARELTLPAPPPAAPRPVGERPRVGLMSPLFAISPVYFLTIGALRLLSRRVDLVIVNRGLRVDRGTRAFHSIAAEWHDAANVDAAALAERLRRLDLDLLIDLGGWSDPVGLKALSARPAPRQYKWVGGQSATTGLAAFDGFLTDPEQSPAGADALHSEPLLRLPGGYATYAPDFAVDEVPVPDEADARRFGLGVIGNPAKISRAFLVRLAARLDEAATEVLFVDRRYRHAPAARRIVDALPARHRPRLHFVGPADRGDYLRHVRRPGRIVDTFPYNGGLTSLEALYMGRPIEVARSGRLFSSRHTASHFHYWRSAERRDHHRLAASLAALVGAPAAPGGRGGRR
jgi:predicted O-linked N-acetylglucosamine transferase (SPINDLY family)